LDIGDEYDESNLFVNVSNSEYPGAELLIDGRGLNAGI